MSSSTRDRSAVEIAHFAITFLGVILGAASIVLRSAPLGIFAVVILLLGTGFFLLNSLFEE